MPRKMIVKYWQIAAHQPSHAMYAAAHSQIKDSLLHTCKNHTILLIFTKDLSLTTLVPFATKSIKAVITHGFISDPNACKNHLKSKSRHYSWHLQSPRVQFPKHTTTRANRQSLRKPSSPYLQNKDASNNHEETHLLPLTSPSPILKVEDEGWLCLHSHCRPKPQQSRSRILNILIFFTPS